MATRHETLTCGDIVDIWHARHNGDNIDDGLNRIRTAARNSRGSQQCLANLENAIATAGGTYTEWAAWAELLNTWTWGFPPHHSRLPDIDTYHPQQ